MSFNTFGKLFRFSTWGESHGPAIGCVVDGCPPNISIKEQDIQIELDKRKPGQSKFTTQRKEDDKVQILSGVFEGQPSTIQPIAGPWDSPQVVKRNSFPKVLNDINLYYIDYFV